MKRWAKELNARPEQIKRSPAGKVQAGMQKQTVEHMNPLVKSLEKHSVNSDIRAHLTTITRFFSKFCGLLNPSSFVTITSLFFG